MSKLNAKKVFDLFLDCFYEDNELEDGKCPKDAIYVTGISENFGFNPVKIKEHKEEIDNLIDEVNDMFDEGIPFVMLPFDKDGNQWGEQIDGERLMCLGIATGKLVYCFPREMWHILPGGVPYVGTKKII